jgi:hypothetical protein
MLLLTRLEAEAISEALDEPEDENLNSEARIIVEALLEQDDHKHIKELLDQCDSL